MVQHMIPELSAIQALSVEGSRLDTEPSTILNFSVDGSTPDTRTVHDSGPKRGRFGLGEWNHPRYRHQPWTVRAWILNRPRYQPSAWMVQHLIPALSMIQALSVEGPALNPEPSTISTFSVDGSTLEPRTIRAEAPNRGRFAASK